MLILIWSGNNIHITCMLYISFVYGYIYHYTRKRESAGGGGREEGVESRAANRRGVWKMEDTQTHTRTHAHTLTLSHTLCLSLTHTHTYATHTRTYTYAHTHTHSREMEEKGSNMCVFACVVVYVRKFDKTLP